MSRNITEVAWGYSGRLPSGISFKEETGTFSGTPTKVGEYTIPVTVWTNYGQDTKDVKIRVRPEGHEVYTIGANAQKWSGNAEPDEDGFYKLNIPKVVRLKHIWEGCAAETSLGEWYLLGEGCYGFPSNDYDVTQPLKVPYDDVIDISYATVNNGNPTQSVHFLCADGTAFSYDAHLNNPIVLDSNNIFTARENRITGVIKLADQWQDKRGVSYDLSAYNTLLCVDNKICVIGASISEDAVEKAYDVGLSGKAIKTFCRGNVLNVQDALALTNDGELFMLCPSTKNNKERYPNYPLLRKFNCPKGDIKELYSPKINYCENINARPVTSTSIQHLILTTDNKLYAIQTLPIYMGSINSLESTESSEYYLFLGEYNVKKISGNFMLTEEGALYLWGNLDWQQSSFAYYDTALRVFPNKKFDDIVLAEKTLIATIKE